MGMSAGSADGEPMMEINTTPLIDVMLVLLIMFIITIPIQTHSVNIDLPPQDLATVDRPDPVRNRIRIAQTGEINWNGKRVDRAQLRRLVEVSQQMRPVPELQLEPEALAPYAAVDEVRAVTKGAQVRKMGFVGNEKYVSSF